MLYTVWLNENHQRVWEGKLREFFRRTDVIRVMVFDNETYSPYYLFNQLNISLYRTCPGKEPTDMFSRFAYNAMHRVLDNLAMPIRQTKNMLSGALVGIEKLTGNGVEVQQNFRRIAERHYLQIDNPMLHMALVEYSYLTFVKLFNQIPTPDLTTRFDEASKQAFEMTRLMIPIFKGDFILTEKPNIVGTTGSSESDKLLAAMKIDIVDYHRAMYNVINVLQIPTDVLPREFLPNLIAEVHGLGLMMDQALAAIANGLKNELLTKGSKPAEEEAPVKFDPDVAVVDPIARRQLADILLKRLHTTKLYKYARPFINLGEHDHVDDFVHAAQQYNERREVGDVEWTIPVREELDKLEATLTDFYRRVVYENAAKHREDLCSTRSEAFELLETVADFPYQRYLQIFNKLLAKKEIDPNGPEGEALDTYSADQGLWGLTLNMEGETLLRFVENRLILNLTDLTSQPTVTTESMQRAHDKLAFAGKLLRWGADLKDWDEVVASVTEALPELVISDRRDQYEQRAIQLILDMTDEQVPDQVPIKDFLAQFYVEVVKVVNDNALRDRKNSLPKLRTTDVFSAERHKSAPVEVPTQHELTEPDWETLIPDDSRNDEVMDKDEIINELMNEIDEVTIEAIMYLLPKRVQVQDILKANNGSLRFKVREIPKVVKRIVECTAARILAEAGKDAF